MGGAVICSSSMKLDSKRALYAARPLRQAWRLHIVGAHVKVNKFEQTPVAGQLLSSPEAGSGFTSSLPERLGVWNQEPRLRYGSRQMGSGRLQDLARDASSALVNRVSVAEKSLTIA